MRPGDDSIEFALETCLVGSGVFFSHDKTLNKLLSLQYRVHFHIIEQEKINVAACKVLLGECLKAEKDLASDLHKKVLFNLVGILKYYASAHEESSTQLKQAHGLTIDNEAFDVFLNLENLYYRGLLEKDTKSIYVKELMGIVPKIPKETHALIFHYMQLIIEKLSMDWKTVLSSFPPSPLTYYIAVHLDHKGHDEDLLNIGREYLAAAKFPTADEINNFDLEEFHAVLQYYFRAQKSKISQQWKEVIVGSMSKTFQSMRISKSAMCYFAHEGKIHESILNFVNLVNYNKNYEDLNNGKLFDFASLIQVYQFILTKAAGHDIPHIFNYQETIERFLKLLETFYAHYSVPVIKKEDSLDWISNCTRLVLPRMLKKLLAKSWHVFYIQNSQNLSRLINNDNSYYLANSLSADPDNSTVKFQYAFTLAQKREIQLAVKFTKSAILETEPNNYQAWHLLALCESVNEDKDVSFKIVCSVLEAMREANEEGLINSARDKWQYIHLKLTQLSIMEDILGANDALELLPDLFQLFNKLFEKGESNIGAASNQTKEYLLQLLWLFALRLYMSAENQDEAENSLSESLKVEAGFKNLNNNLAAGYLALEVDGNKALKEFETVLFYDKLNVDAIVGIARSLLPDVPVESQHKLVKIGTKPKLRRDGFSGERDRSAAFARLKLLLEQAIEKSIDAYNTPEVWWYLSQIYEIYGDADRQEISLWNCVKFQELQPIRDFRNCNP